MKNNCDLFNPELLKEHESQHQKGVMIRECLEVSKLETNLLPKELRNIVETTKKFYATPTSERSPNLWNQQMDIENEMLVFLREGKI